MVLATIQVKMEVALVMGRLGSSNSCLQQVVQDTLRRHQFFEIALTPQGIATQQVQTRYVLQHRDCWRHATH